MLKLDRIVSLFPRPWPQHPPASRTHIEKALRDPISAAVIGTNPKRFSGICDVPRYFYPEASEEALLLGLELNIWYFYFDDPFDDGDINPVERAEGAALIGRMTKLLATGVLPPNASPLERLCLQFRERARRLCRARPQTWRRFLQSCMRWTDSVLPAAKIQHAPTPPDLLTYNNARCTNIGIIPLAYINEIDGPLQFDRSFFGRPEIRRLHELTCSIIIHCNDLYSYEKERQRSARPFNSVFLRQYHQGLGLEAAFEQHLGGIGVWLKELATLEDILLAKELGGRDPAKENPDTVKIRQAQVQYIQRLNRLILGNHLWSIYGGRYSSATSPFEELRIFEQERQIIAP